MTKITAEDIEAGKSSAGGYTRAQVEKWGVPWPLVKGWKKRLIGQEPLQPNLLDWERPEPKPKKEWVDPSRWIPDNPSPRSSWLHQSTNIAKDMRKQLEESGIDTMI